MRKASKIYLTDDSRIDSCCRQATGEKLSAAGQILIAACVEKVKLAFAGTAIQPGGAVLGAPTGSESVHLSVSLC